MRQRIGPQTELPWDTPGRMAEDVREFMREAEREYKRQMSGHRAPLEVMAVDVVESNSRPGVFHHMKRHSDGTWSCSCEAYTYTRDCPHVRRKLEELAR